MASERRFLRRAMPIEPTFKHTGLASPITEFALALAAKRDGLWVPSGTAMVIAPYLALTAKHVIEDFWRRFEQAPLDGLNPGTFSIVACQIVENGKTGQAWSVTKLTLSTFTDVAFLHLTNPIGGIPGYQWRGAKLCFASPLRLSARGSWALDTTVHALTLGNTGTAVLKSSGTTLQLLPSAKWSRFIPEGATRRCFLSLAIGQMRDSSME
jgi:hypothetical protein